MNFSFATAGEILFGPGVVRQVGALVEKLGRRVLLVTGRNRDRAAPVEASLHKVGIEPDWYQVTREPDVAMVDEGARTARRKGCDVVVACGGGSVIDTGKAIAALAANTGPVTDYLEVIGKAQPLLVAPLVCLAIPTTAGTGSEVTRNAVIRSPEKRVKVSLRHRQMLPVAAVVDPELTLSLPPAITAATGFDALCQLLEAYVSTKANPLTDSLCRDGLIRCARALEVVFHQGDNLVARTDMALASLFSGLALANAGLGAVHGIAGPLGGMYPAPHGAVCACLLPFVTAANIEALETAAEDQPAIKRLINAAVWLTGQPDAAARDLVLWLERLSTQFDIAPLSRWGLRPGDVPFLAAQALKASSMKGNPVSLGIDTLEQIIHQALDDTGHCL